MAMTGTVINGAIVPDNAARLREGARYFLEPAEGEFPPDHPMAPYDRDNEVAIIRASIMDKEPAIPLRKAFEEISLKLNLGPLPPE